MLQPCSTAQVTARTSRAATCARLISQRRPTLPHPAWRSACLAVQCSAVQCTLSPVGQNDQCQPAAWERARQPAAWERASQQAAQLPACCTTSRISFETTAWGARLARFPHMHGSRTWEDQVPVKRQRPPPNSLDSACVVQAGAQLLARVCAMAPGRSCSCKNSSCPHGRAVWLTEAGLILKPVAGVTPMATAACPPENLVDSILVDGPWPAAAGSTQVGDVGPWHTAWFKYIRLAAHMG